MRMENSEQLPHSENESPKDMDRRKFLSAAGATAFVAALGLGNGSEAHAQGIRDAHLESISAAREWLEKNGISSFDPELLKAGIIGAQPGAILQGDLAIISPLLKGFGNVNQIALESDRSLRWIIAPQGQSLTGDFSGIPGLRKKIEEKIVEAGKGESDNRIIMNELMLEKYLTDNMEIYGVYFEGERAKIESLLRDPIYVDLKN